MGWGVVLGGIKEVEERTRQGRLRRKRNTNRLKQYSSRTFCLTCSLRSCPLPIIPLSLLREEGMIHFFVGSHVKMPESGLFSDWIGNNADDLRCSDWPK